MSIPFKCFVIAAVSLGCFGGALLIGRAQARPVEPVAPFVVSGGDLGFRVEGRQGTSPVGRIVIRKDANSPWIPVESAAIAAPRQLD
jgi:hypothetical protein